MLLQDRALEMPNAEIKRFYPCSLGTITLNGNTQLILNPIETGNTQQLRPGLCQYEDRSLVFSAGFGKHPTSEGRACDCYHGVQHFLRGLEGLRWGRALVCINKHNSCTGAGF